MDNVSATPRSLLDFDAPTLNQKQIELCKQVDLHVTEAGEFDPESVLSKLKEKVGQRVIGIDIGGDKATTQLFTVSDQGLTPDEAYSDFRQDNQGQGYLESLEKTANFAVEHNIPVGISYGIPLNGTKPADRTKLPVLLNDMAKYSEDFAVLFPTLGAIMNDGPAGMISGVIQASRISPTPISEAVLIINGGGIGASILKDNKIYATEAGHAVPIVDELNRYHDTRPCRVFGATHTCVELVASNKRGIEEIWRQKTGITLSAIDIEKQFTENGEHGDLALELYEYSACVLAHLAKGLADAFEIDIYAASSALIGHGGAFKFPDYGARIKQILDNAGQGKEINLLLTKDYSKNACLEGAALFAAAFT